MAPTHIWGLTYDERIIEAAIAATRKYGTGCAGSRFLKWYTRPSCSVRKKNWQKFVGKDDALVYSTGFTVNEGVVSCLTDRNDYIICDDRDHASIVDGRRLSFSTQLKYKHNDMEALEKELQKCKPESVKLIVVDGVFSDGVLYYKGSKDITWETSNSFNVGVDFALLGGRIDGTIEYFNRQTKDMLYYKPVAMSNGYTQLPMNIGSVRNSGGGNRIELYSY